jgi:2'-5' RNA ligase
VVDALSAWQLRELDGRIVPAENLHATLAFLGSRPAGELAAIAGALRESAAAVRPPRFALRGYRETRSVGMLTFDDEDGRGAELADDLFGRLEALGVYRREARPWLPHVTVVRFRKRLGLDPPLPEIGRFAPSEAAAFLSRLHPSGARYEVIASCSLGGGPVARSVEDVESGG